MLGPLLGSLPSVEGMGAIQGVDTILTSLRLSRFLVWQPAGWATAGMALPVAGRWGAGLAFLALSLATAAALYWAHAAITRRMMQGVALRTGTERVRSQRWTLDLPGPAVFWALFLKDWTYLRRSPVTRQILIGAPIVAVAFGVGLWQVSNYTPVGNPIRDALPVLAAAVLLISVNLAMVNYTANYFGAVDREGFATLMLSPVDRRYVLVSGNLMTLILALGQDLALLLIVAIAGRSWIVLPWGLFVAVCLHVSTVPAYGLASVIGAYRARHEWINSRNQGSLWMFVAWVVASPPVVLLCLLPYLLWRPGLAITMPLAALYSAGIYLLTLKPLARLVDRRTFQILAAVSHEE